MNSNRCIIWAASACTLIGCGGGGGDSGSPAPASSVTPASCDSQTGAGFPAIRVERAFPNLNFNQPLALLSSVLGERFFVAEKEGRILSFINDETVTTTTNFADLTTQVDARGEGGLLGMAFDPNFQNNGFVYLSYTTSDDPINDNGGNFRSVISRFSVNMTGTAIDAASEAILLTLPQGFSNHNGGQLGFGPDGFLYIGFGDEGGAGDPADHGQNPATLYGTILRIDVNQGDALRGLPYSIPPANPNAASLSCNDNGCPEIYAFGFRNPWRWSFDRSTGDLWTGDVGQDAWEEIDRVSSGKNFAWRCLESSHGFNDLNCADKPFEPPVAEYSHTEGQSVTGGYVYRGSTIVSLQGSYLFGDFSNGRIWGLFEPYSAAPDCRLLADSDLSISSFAEDNSGELFVIDFSGPLYRINSN